MFFAGVDIGSTSTECVILNESGEIVAADMRPTGANSAKAAQAVLDSAVEKAGLDAPPHRIVATGYGRVSAPFAHKVVTEITCHARGVLHLFPQVRTIVDVGGQDSKVIRIGPKGNVIDFVMNDKCSAGSGRFLEVMARALEVELDDLGPLSEKSAEEISISSMCTVFAESEVISLVARAVPVEDIINGIHKSIVNRLASQMQRMNPEPDIVMTGGVAKNSGMVKKLSMAAGHTVLVPENPRMTGALGAALTAMGLERE
ncbi:benzoyl-CoA reductase, bcr type, subunit D [Desulfatibacillum alkenivorans DSM 16219]|jgi:predicted CoA-substrate-specific enzyme activase|uniref:Benzoyl-CoA reductase, bcr type, subunit D n=1 Tax=Desulfatibacillum alkenivorans DSM 16219 TaxID=1121393 RepID=A0A1M6J850_9BACT|nr:acyl-CoA dehydratase activase [Desulfatibacillum alkenivorans]SHJ42879.1 benzoyl-CoA reductase, bcr type, subunit D [Desulfatibacillum alkenivorans DSM 16219]